MYDSTVYDVRRAVRVYSAKRYFDPARFRIPCERATVELPRIITDLPFRARTPVFPPAIILSFQRFLLTIKTVLHTVCIVHYMSHSNSNHELFENLRLELRRGCLGLAVMSQLRTERYGYTLRKALAEQGLEIDESTLYPLLRRLENQGLLTSVWREEEKRNKRFYRLSPEGKLMLKQLGAEWQKINATLEGIL